MNVFTIEAHQGKAMVMETLMSHFPEHRYTAEKDNCAFIINEPVMSVPFPNRTFNLGLNEDADTKKVAKVIYNTAIAYGFKNIFIYANELKNRRFIAELITEFNSFFVEGGGMNSGNVFIFCQPNF